MDKPPLFIVQTNYHWTDHQTRMFTAEELLDEEEFAAVTSEVDRSIRLLSDIQHYRIHQGQQFEEEIRKFHPKGAIPCIEIGREYFNIILNREPNPPEDDYISLIDAGAQETAQTINAKNFHEILNLEYDFLQYQKHRLPEGITHIDLIVQYESAPKIFNNLISKLDEWHTLEYRQINRPNTLKE